MTHYADLTFPIPSARPFHTLTGAEIRAALRAHVESLTDAAALETVGHVETTDETPDDVPAHAPAPAYVVVTHHYTDTDGETRTFTGPFPTEKDAAAWMDEQPDDEDALEMYALPMNAP